MTSEKFWIIIQQIWLAAAVTSHGFDSLFCWVLVALATIFVLRSPSTTTEKNGT